MNIKIMSFNIQHCKNYITKKIDYKAIADLIKKYNPDIIGLNEVFGNFQIKRIIKNTDYNYCFGKSTNIFFLPYGNVLISKYPINNIEIIKIKNPKNKSGKKHYEKRSILKAKLLVNNKIINVFVTHLGLNLDEQISGINTLNEITNLKNSIIIGDFNIKPDNNLINCLKENYIDSLDNKSYTWPSKNPHIRYDYILVSKDIKIINSSVLNEIVSDHRPIITNINIKKILINKD